MKTNTKEASTKPNQRNNGTHLTHSTHFLTCTNAFTLAETLITLAIIGVVAAITIPSLVQKYQKRVTVTKLQRTYAVMNQAINMAVAENGDVTSWAIDCGISGTATCTTDEALDWFMKYIGKNLKIVKTEKTQTDVGDGFMLYLNDGTILVTNNALIDWFLYLDAKAYKNPIPTRNRFAFRLNPILTNGQDADKNKYSVKSSFEPYAWNWDGTRDGLFHSTNEYGCGESESQYCAKLIQQDGWQIKEDYPW